MDKEISKMGLDVKNQPAVHASTADNNSNPEGFFNVNTGEYKLPAGSIVDLSTVNIIPPPTNAVFDKNSGTYVVPETFGKIDKTTGEYKAPAGLSLGSDGQFKIVDPEAYQKSQAPAESDKKADDRTPASEGSAPAAEEAKAALAPPNMFAGRPEMAIFVTTNAPVVSAAAQTAVTLAAPPPAENPLQALADDQRQKTDLLRQTASETGVTSPTSRVKFIFNAE